MTPLFTRFFCYTDAHGMQQSEIYNLKQVRSQLFEQCKLWNTYTLQALTDHSGIYYQLVRDYSLITIALDAVEGSKLIIDSYEQIGDRHYRISFPDEAEANIKGLGLLESAEPAIGANLDLQEVLIHNKQLKLYFPAEEISRVYEFDFVAERFYASQLNKPSL